jgi:hypothetical protein
LRPTRYACFNQALKPIGERATIFLRKPLPLLQMVSRAYASRLREFPAWLGAGAGTPEMKIYLVVFSDAARMFCATKTLFTGDKHEDDFHHGGSLSDRHFRAFLRCDPRSSKDGKGGSDRNHGTLLPVIRSRIRVRLYKLREMQGNGRRHRRRVQTGSR